MTNTTNVVKFDKEYATEIDALLEVNEVTKEEVATKLDITEMDLQESIDTITHEKPNYSQFYQTVFDTIEEIIDERNSKITNKRVRKQQMRMFPRLELYYGKLVTELTVLRVKNGLTANEVSKHPLIRMSSGLYSNRENGRQSYKVDDYEEFYYLLSTSLPVITEEKRQEVFEMEITDIEKDSRLEFAPVTEEVLEQALAMLSMGKTFIQVSIKFGVNELDLYNRFKKESEEVEEYNEILMNNEECLEGLYF